MLHASRAGGASEIKLPATETATYYLFTVDSVTSADFEAGHYHWQLEITKPRPAIALSLTVARLTQSKTWMSMVQTRAVMRKLWSARLKASCQAKLTAMCLTTASMVRSLTKFSFSELMEARDKLPRRISPRTRQRTGTKRRANRPNNSGEVLTDGIF